MEIRAVCSGKVKVVVICKNEMSQNSWRGPSNAKNRRAGRCVIVLLLLPAFASTGIPSSSL
jgi:hypothetical protein